MFIYLLYIAVFEISAYYQELRIRLFDVNGRTIYTKNNEKKHKITYTTVESGNHKLCIDNYSSNNNTIQFVYKNGIEAKDYSQLARLDNLKPIDVNIAKLQDKMEELFHEMVSFKELEKSNLNEFDRIFGRVIFFSVILFSLMGVITFITISFVRNYLKHRKVI